MHNNTAPYNDAPPRAPVLARTMATLLLFAAAAIRADPREDFLAAEAALDRDDTAAFETLAAGLRDYPLLPFLRFEALKRDLDRATGAKVERFLADYADIPLAGRLRLAWLERLAKRGAWADYARLYLEDDSAERRCLYLRALLETGKYFCVTFGKITPSANGPETGLAVGRKHVNRCHL